MFLIIAYDPLTIVADGSHFGGGPTPTPNEFNGPIAFENDENVINKMKRVIFFIAKLILNPIKIFVCVLSLKFENRMTEAILISLLFYTYDFSLKTNKKSSQK